MDPLILRPHHGLCLLHFVGKGYSDGFVANMAAILEELGRNPGQVVRLLPQTDCLCACCPHNRCGECASGQKVLDYDRACLERCGLEAGAALPWQEYRSLVERNILRQGVLAEVCRNCQWLELCLRQRG